VDVSGAGEPVRGEAVPPGDLGHRGDGSVEGFRQGAVEATRTTAGRGCCGDRGEGLQDPGDGDEVFADDDVPGAGGDEAGQGVVQFLPGSGPVEQWFELTVGCVGVGEVCAVEGGGVGVGGHAEDGQVAQGGDGVVGVLQQPPRVQADPRVPVGELGDRVVGADRWGDQAEVVQPGQPRRSVRRRPSSSTGRRRLGGVEAGGGSGEVGDVGQPGEDPADGGGVQPGLQGA